MDKNLFRKQALEKVSSPSQLDVLIKINSPFSWLFFIALGIFVITGVLWGIFGLIPTKVKGTGIIVSSNNIVKLQFPVSGEVVTLNMKNGDEIKTGQVLARIKQSQLEEKIKLLLARIETLKQNFKTFEYLNQNELKKEIGFLNQQDKSLKDSINELTSHEKWLSGFVEKSQALKSKGAISDMKYHEFIKNLSTLKMDIYNREDQLLDILYKKTMGLSKLRKEYIEREKEIEEKETQLKEMQFELEEKSIFRSPANGKVLEILVGTHQVVHEGADFVILLKGGENEKLDTIVYFPSAEGKKIKKYMTADIVPLTVNPSKYGFIKGIVEEVDEYPSSSTGMLNVLQNPELVKMLTKEGAPIKVKLSLFYSDKNVSGMEWTSSKGPPFIMEAGTMCTVSIIVKEEPPVSFVMPFLKRLLLGYGD